MKESMQDKEIRQLSRADLIEVIYQLQLEKETLTKENEQLRDLLGRQKIKAEQAGSLAEAALSLSGVFQKAQEAADIYLRNIAEMQETEVKKLEEVNWIVSETKKRVRAYLKEIQKDAGEAADA